MLRLIRFVTAKLARHTPTNLPTAHGLNALSTSVRDEIAHVRSLDGSGAFHHNSPPTLGVVDPLSEPPHLDPMLPVASEAPQLSQSDGSHISLLHKPAEPSRR